MSHPTLRLTAQLLVALILGAVAPFIEMAAPPAQADHNASHVPAARMQMVMKSIHVFDDNDWIGSGDISLYLQVLACKSYEPHGVVPCDIDRRVASALITLSAGSGDTVPVTTIVAKRKIGLEGLEKSDAEDDTFPVYSGERYVVSIIGLERDEPLQFDQLIINPWEFTGYLLPDGLDFMGAGALTFDEGNNFAVGSHSVLGSKDFGADFSAEFELRDIALPDLVPHHGVYRRLDDGRETICVSALNKGQVASNTFQLHAYLEVPIGPDIDLGGFLMPGLLPSEALDHCFLITAPTYTPLIPGDYTVKMLVDPDKELAEVMESNNYLEESFKIANPATAPAAAAPDSRADLSIGNIRVTGKEPSGSNDCDPGKNDVTVTVKNVGQAAAAAFTVRLQIGDQDSGKEKSVTSLAAGKDQDVTFDDVNLKKGDQRLNINLDSKKAVDEADENNNQQMFTISCRDE